MSHSASHSPLRSSSPCPSTRPKKHKLTEEEINFLRTYLPAYSAYCATLLQRAEGQRKVKNTKGNKKDWVLQTVFQPFLKKFGADGPSGPNLDDLREKICRWFFNHLKSDISIATSTSSPKRPRAINAELVFGEEQKAAINEEVLKQSSGQTSEGSKPEFKLSEYNKIRKELFNNLEDNQKQAYTEQAATRNKELRDGPDRSVIFANQNHITEDVLKTLQALIGWNWGQHGAVVLFVQGAFRDEHERLKLFDTSASVGPNPTVQRFRSELPDYEAVFRKAFKAYANRELLASIQPNALRILQNDTGFPLLPSVDVNDINPSNARCMLKEYIKMAWKSSLPAQQSLIPSLPAWDILNDPEQRKKILTDTDTNFPGLKSLDPVQMNISDLFSSILIIKNAQDKGRFLLKFTFPKNSSLATEDREIVELSSPPKSRASSRILSQQSPSSAKLPAATPKHTLVKIPDFSPKRLTAKLPARAAPTCTTGIPPGMRHKPQVKPSLKKVVPHISKSSSISFDLALDVPDPTSSLPDSNVSAADINAEKRKKRKTDDGDDVNVQSNRPAATKKQRIEEVILPRTSSRIHGKGYINKHVTIRKR